MSSQRVLPPRLNLPVPLDLVIGFIAGFTLANVFIKFPGTDVFNIGPVTVKKP